MLKQKIEKLLGSGLQTKIAKGIFWSFLGVLISRGFLFIAYILISKVTTIQQYGEIGILKSAITTFSLFSVASFGITATRYISIFLEKDVKKTERILSLTYFMTILISLIIFVLIIVFRKGFASELLGNENFEIISVIIGFGILFSAINGFQNGALAGFEQFKSISIINIIFGLLSLPILFFTTKFYGVIGFCAGMSMIYFVLSIFSAIYLNKVMKIKNMKFTYKDIKEEFVILKEFSIPAFLGGFIVSPTILICNSILVKSQGGFIQMGIYDAAFNFSIIAMTFNGMIGQVLYPYAMKMGNKNNPKFDFLNMNAPWLIGVFFGIILIYLPDIFSLIFDKNFHQREMYMTVSTIAIFIIFISHRQGISRNLAVMNKMWYGFIDNAIWAIIAVLFTYILVDKGAYGRAMAFVIAYFINSLIILPIYLRLKLFKRSYILSKENLLIWLVIFFSYLSIFYDFDIYIRLILMCFSLSFIAIISYNWYRIIAKRKRGL